MGFYAEDPLSGLTIGQAIYEVALIIAVLRWVLCLVFRMINDRTTQSDETSPAEQTTRDKYNNPLVLTTFGEIKERLPQTTEEDTCAVCLSQLSVQDEVRELMNCCHVFHRECIDRWLEHEQEYENHSPTCPLCRAPLLSSCSATCLPPPPQPSWAVERLLYLFGDDLLPC